MLEAYGVTEANWRDATEAPPHFAISESPAFVGRAVAALAADPDVARWNGQSLSSGQLARVYGFTDLDGSQPDAWRYVLEVQDAGQPADTTGYEAVEVHHLVPRRHEVAHELLLGVVGGVDLGEGPELGVRAEDEVDGRGRPLDLARRAIATLVHVLGRGGRPPLRAHVEQVHEEVVGQRPGPVGEDAVRGLPVVGVQRPHAADEHRHLGRGQRQQVGPVEQQRLRRQLLAGSEVVAEPVGRRLEHGERLDVGLLLRGVGAPGANGTVTSCPASFAACSTAAQPPRTIRSASETFLPPDCEPLKSCWIRSRVCSTLASSAGSLTSQSFCGARRIRAPLAPPRLSVPRKLAADAHAVETSWEIDSPSRGPCP